jgi:two-component system chemotaxis response regulator CheB
MGEGRVKVSGDKVRSLADEKNKFQYIVAIGTSAGGPKALQQVIPLLPKTLPATYIVVQHMPKHFTFSLAQRLNELSQVEVVEASDGEILQSGVVYIAPGGKQLRVSKHKHFYISAREEGSYKGHEPSVNIMMNSIAHLKEMNQKIIGVILTGMGNDGLEGVKNLKEQCGAQIIVEDESTCVVYGMPKAVVNEHLQDYCVPIDKIVSTIIKVMGE